MIGHKEIVGILLAMDASILTLWMNYEYGWTPLSVAAGMDIRRL
jgi:hypothetical protein